MASGPLTPSFDLLAYGRMGKSINNDAILLRWLPRHIITDPSQAEITAKQEQAHDENLTSGVLQARALHNCVLL
jgi:hypothetical protein